uniref:Uncharacterized protein n=1 Tax=Panagrolaimus superbus TaxID=310955 RepID=A0A914ZCC1_9BILA
MLVKERYYLLLSHSTATSSWQTLNGTHSFLRFPALTVPSSQTQRAFPHARGQDGIDSGKDVQSQEASHSLEYSGQFEKTSFSPHPS